MSVIVFNAFSKRKIFTCFHRWSYFIEIHTHKRNRVILIICIKLVFCNVNGDRYGFKEWRVTWNLIIVKKIKTVEKKCTRTEILKMFKRKYRCVYVCVCMVIFDRKNNNGNPCKVINNSGGSNFHDVIILLRKKILDFYIRVMVFSIK